MLEPVEYVERPRPAASAVAWGISLVLHVVLLIVFAGVGWSLHAGRPSSPLEVGVVVDDGATITSPTADLSRIASPAPDLDMPDALANLDVDPIEAIETTTEAGSTAAQLIASLDGSDDSPAAADDVWLGLGTALARGEGAVGALYRNRMQQGRPGAFAAGASPQSEAAVEAGLAWLARAQRPNGAWTGPSRYGDHPLGCTGLATLAFLGAGHTHRHEGKYRQNVLRALEWILEQENRESGQLRYSRFYEQGIATMAVCEALSMTRDRGLRPRAERFVRYTVSQMAEHGGYGYNGPGDDTHVTSFQIMAIKSGMLAELGVPTAAVERLKGYLDRSIHEDGTTGYRSDSPDGRVKGARTSAGLLCRLFLDYGREHPDVVKTASLIHKTGPDATDVFYTYNATYSMFQMGGRFWEDWNRAFRDEVVALQFQTPPTVAGSWNADVVYTAFYIMALEVYYRYLPVYQ